MFTGIVEATGKEAVITDATTLSDENGGTRIYAE